MDRALDRILESFLYGAGRTAQEFGLGRLFGQVYFLLLFSKEPLSLDDISELLGVSKASASNTVRKLEHWKAVRRIWKKGDRKDYFLAEDNFRQILDNGILSQVRHKLDTVDTEIRQAQESLHNLDEESQGEDVEAIDLYKRRLKNLKRIIDKAKLALNSPFLKKLL